MRFKIFLELAFVSEAFPSHEVSRDQDNIACTNCAELESSFTFRSELTRPRKCTGSQFCKELQLVSTYASTLWVDFA